MRACLLVYDVPSNSPMPNPSPWLRRVGFRANLSAWVIPEDALPWNLLNGLTEGGASWHVVKFADEEGENLLRMAEIALRRDVEQARRRAALSVERAESELDGAEPTDEALVAFRRRSRAALRRAERLLEAAESAARTFGLDPSGLPLELARHTVASLQTMAHTRAHLYAGLVERAKETALAASARASEIPALILADYLEEERGEDCTSAREAFAS